MDSSDQKGASETRDLLLRFVSGLDRSMQLAASLEGHLVEHFPDNPEAVELADLLACYKPGGGQFLFDEEHIARTCEMVLARLRVEGDRRR